jgi:hypothetical protein
LSREISNVEYEKIKDFLSKRYIFTPSLEKLVKKVKQISSRFNNDLELAKEYYKEKMEAIAHSSEYIDSLILEDKEKGDLVIEGYDGVEGWYDKNESEWVDDITEEEDFTEEAEENEKSDKIESSEERIENEKMKRKRKRKKDDELQICSEIGNEDFQKKARVNECSIDDGRNVLFRKASDVLSKENEKKIE